MEIGEKIIVALVIVVTIAVILGVAMMPAIEHEMTKPEGCRNCHEMIPYYDSLQVSAHKGMDCHECHRYYIPKMFLYMGHALHHLQFLQKSAKEGISLEELAKEIEDKPPASPKNEYCMECHGRGGAPIPADKVSSHDISCFECHYQTSHTGHEISKYKGYESPDYSGYECVACHDDHIMEVKEETCKSCHPPELHP
ncbi:MAG: hypothetical protein ACXQTS_01455 [Candidatus Methanospirareceae archaeon]